MRLILAVEPLTNHTFGPAYARKMKLPFHVGWDHYLVYDDQGFLGRAQTYRQAKGLTRAIAA